MAQIKKDTSLRKAILQAAITGQLISSCHSELDSESAETGKELLDKIIEERNNKLLAEWEEKQTDLFASNDAHSKNAKTVRSEQIRLLKKAKKPALVVASEIDEEEIPFEIPENWCWCRFGDICIAQLGKTLDKVKNKGDEVPYLCSINVNWGKIDLEKVKTLKLEESEKQKYLLEKGDLLICEGGDVGRSAIWNLDEIMYYQNALHRVRFFLNLNQKYFYYVLFQYKNLGFLDAVSKGMTIKHLVQGALLNLAIPLPPLAVQNAIVAKLEQVLPLVDAYENALLQKEELKSVLPDKIKKAILQEAITGKLTEQWRKQKAVVEPTVPEQCRRVETTERGEQLLDRIIKERNAKALSEWEEALKKNPKAKKPAPIVASEIDEEEIPFEVPESWCWCKLGDICTKLVDGDHNPPAGVPTKTEFIMASSQNINDDSLVELEKVRYLSKEVFEVENERTKAEKGDIFFTSVGTLGRSCIFDGSRNICFQRSVSVIKTEIYNKFLKYCLDAPFIQYFIIDNATGTAQKGFYLNQLAKLVIPLPPLEEQEEIVKKVEELLPLC